MIASRERESIRDEIATCCRKLTLSRNVAKLCEEESTPRQEDFLLRVLKEEVEGRERTKRTRLLNKAGFPVYKTLEEFQFRAVTLPSTLSRDELVEGAFIAEKRNLVMYGEVGTGKTHLAIAIGVKACEQGLTVRFFTVAELISRLSEAKRCGTLERLLNDLQRVELLILDEWGYIPVDREGSQLLFRIIADSYETRSLVITTNLEFSKWGTAFTDDQMAAAMIDRLAHHGQLLVFSGPSYRMEHALMKKR